MEKGDVKKCDLVIWAILLINKMYVLRLENEQVGMLKIVAKFRDNIPTPAPFHPHPPTPYIYCFKMSIGYLL